MQVSDQIHSTYSESLIQTTNTEPLKWPGQHGYPINLQ